MMRSLSFFGYLKGSVKIRVDGFFTERFINLCVMEGILLWNIKRAGTERIYACVSPKDFKRLKAAAKKTKSRIKIVKKSGAPFAAFRYRKRKYAAIGIVFLAAAVWFYSTHVMGIDIKGNERIKTETLSAALKEFGVYGGASLEKIDRKKVQNNMMTRLEDISWIGVNIKGSRVYIEVKERLEKPKALESDVPCDLIAAEDGIIDELDVREGQSMVRRSEFVEKGDLLVSGAMDSAQTGIRYVHSYGEVYAITNKSLKEEYKRVITEKTPTGREKRKLSIVFGEKRIGLYLKAEPEYKNYEKKIIKTENPIFPKIYAETAVFSEQSAKQKKRSDKEIFELGKKELSKKIEKNLKENSLIKNISAKFEEKDPETLVVTVNFEIRENIAEERKIDKTENLNYDIDMSKNNAPLNE